MTEHQHPNEHTPWYQNRIVLGLAGFLIVAGYFLASKHQAHFIAFLPYLLLLACALMHLFMHGGHDHHEKHDGDTRDKPGKGE